MKNEITVIKPEEFGLEKSQAVTIEEAFLPKIAEREILSSQYSELIKKDITAETCQEATLLRRKLVKVRTGISDIHKKQKAFYLAAGKFVDAWKNKETIPVSQMEEGLTNIETHFEKIEEAKREVIREARSAELEKYETVYGAGDIALMEDELYKHFLNGVKSDFEARKAEEKRIEDDIIQHQKDQELFDGRKEKLIQFSQFNIQNELNLDTTEKEFISIVEKGEKMKDEFDKEQIRIKDENERLKKERKEQIIADEKAEKERQRLAKIEQDKRDKIERERLAKAEAERKQREAEEEKERKYHEAQLKRVNDEKARIQKELEVKAEDERIAQAAEVDRLKAESDAARKAELAPDKERLTKWVDGMLIKGIGAENMSKESIEIANEIFTKFSNFKSWAKGEIEKIK